MHTVYLLLGSNQGDKEALLRKACGEIQARIGAIIHSSSLYESEPWGFEAGEWFVNRVLQVKTVLTPEQLLMLIHEIEQQLGRVRNWTENYESRTMDIDILFYDDLILQTDHLIIPHPHLHKRRFTLLPLAEITPALRHPLLQKNIAALLCESSDKSIVRKLY